MRGIDLSKATWRKSSYSNTDGGACVEVSDDFLSAAWRKSSYSNSDGGNCVEVAHNLPLVPVRDSKDTARTPLVFAGTAWAVFVEHIKS